MEAVLQPKVIFFRVSNNQTKILRIYTTIQRHFEKGEKVLVILPNQEAEKYFDELLWKIPPESFLPHTRTSKPCQARIVVTEVQKNLNQATVLWNLCPEVTPLYNQFEMIYELLDETSKEKEKQSTNKIAAYKEKIKEKGTEAQRHYPVIT